ncbi:MAG: SRPBCC family protein [Thermoanaerobaculia bacterium]
MSEKREERVLEMVREVGAPPERVFRALTAPEELLQWWGRHAEANPPGGKRGSVLVGARTDPRPGGRYRLDFRMPDGGTAWLEGEYQVLEPPQRIVQTWLASSHPGLETVLEFRLEPSPSGTRLTLRHSGLDAMPGAYRDHELGWIEALGHLTGWLIAVAGFFSARGAGGTED